MSKKSYLEDIFGNDKEYKKIKKLKLHNEIAWLNGMGWQLECVKNDFARELLNYRFPPSMEITVNEILGDYKEKIVQYLTSEIKELETVILDDYYSNHE